MMKAPLAALAIAVAVALGSSVDRPSGHAEIPTSGDCAAQVRADGIVYTSYGHTEQPATQHSSAQEADCSDVGPDAEGAVFPATARLVTTWRFADYPPAKVVGVRSDSGDTFAVFVADSVSPQERDRIFADLAGTTS